MHDIAAMALNYQQGKDIWTGKELEGEDLRDYLWEMAGMEFERAEKEKRRAGLLLELERLRHG